MDFNMNKVQNKLQNPKLSRKKTKPIDPVKKAKIVELFNKILENDDIFRNIFQCLNLKNMWMLLQINRYFKYEIV